jgi:ketosteroid isomerase-like protein
MGGTDKKGMESQKVRSIAEQLSRVQGELTDATANAEKAVRQLRWVWEGDDAGLPGSGRHEGKQASIAVLIEAASALDKLDLDPQEFFENGDTAVVVGYQDIAKDGRSARVPFVHIWRFRGNQICGVRLVLDTLTTAKVFGTT